jgi:hypothetical protein
MRQRDTRTLDLYRDFEPPAVVERFSPEETKGWTPAARLSKAVALALDDYAPGREAAAEAMSEVLGDKVSKSLLDKYASQAAEGHTISALRLMALVAVTSDVRPLNTLLEGAGLIVVDKKYEALLRREQARLLKERAEREEQAADAEWRARR